MNWVTIGRVAKAAALLAFFLPWAAVSCQGQEMGQFTGLNLAFGGGSLPDAGDSLPSTEGAILPTAIASFLAGLAALAISIFQTGHKASRHAMFASAAAAALVFLVPYELWFRIVSALQENGANSGAEDFIRVKRMEGFWLALLGFSAAAVALYQHERGAPLPQFPAMGGPEPAPRRTDPSNPQAGADPQAVTASEPLLASSASTLSQASASLATSVQAAGQAARSMQAQSEVFAPGRLGPILMLALALGFLLALERIANNSLFDRYTQVSGLDQDTGAFDQFYKWDALSSWAAMGVGLAGLVLVMLAGHRLRTGLVYLAGGLAVICAVAFFRAPTPTLLFVAFTLFYMSLAVLRPAALSIVAERLSGGSRATGVALLMAGASAISVWLSRWSSGWGDESGGAIGAVGAPMLSVVLALGFLASLVVAMMMSRGPVAPFDAQTDQSEQEPKEDQGPSAFGLVIKDPAALHLLLVGMLAPFLAILANAEFFRQLREGWRDTDSAFFASDNVAFLQFSPALGFLLGGVVTDMLARRDVRWRAWGPAAFFGAGAGALALSITSEDVGLAAGFGVACLWAPLVPVAAFLAGRVRPSQRPAVLALATLGFILVWSPLINWVGELVAFLAANGLSSPESDAMDASDIAPFATRLALVLLIFWPIAHCMLAARSITEQAENRRAPVLMLGALAAALLVGIAAAFWTLAPQGPPMLAQARAKIEAAFVRQTSATDGQGVDTAVDVAPSLVEPMAEAATPEPLGGLAPPTAFAPGQAWAGFTLDTSCRLSFNGAPVATLERARFEDEKPCEYDPVFEVSPSGNRVLIHIARSDYGFSNTAVVDLAGGRVVSVAADSGNDRYGSLNAWSAAEDQAIMVRPNYLGPSLGENYQFGVAEPCVMAFEPYGLICAEGGDLVGALVVAAGNADPAARCIAQRACHLNMEISDVTPTADGFMLRGSVILSRNGLVFDEQLSDDASLNEDVVLRLAMTARLSAGAVVSGIALRPWGSE